MDINGLTAVALVVFFMLAAAMLYRWLMHVCGKLCEYRHSQAQATAREDRS